MITRRAIVQGSSGELKAAMRQYLQSYPAYVFILDRARLLRPRPTLREMEQISIWSQKHGDRVVDGKEILLHVCLLRNEKDEKRRERVARFSATNVQPLIDYLKE